jgi:hypothetical protein
MKLWVWMSLLSLGVITSTTSYAADSMNPCCCCKKAQDTCCEREKTEQMPNSHNHR